MNAPLILSALTAMIREAFHLEYITIFWMVIEAAVAIGSAIAANSLLLLAFGIDSLIELISAGVLVWRLGVELRDGRTFAETAERRAARIGGGLLFTLALYVVAIAAWRLWTQQGAEFSLPASWSVPSQCRSCTSCPAASSALPRRWRAGHYAPTPLKA